MPQRRACVRATLISLKNGPKCNVDMPKGSHKALPLGEKVKVLSLIKTITSLAAVARIRGKNESSFVKLWRKNRNFTLALLTRFRLQALREDGNGLTTARVGPPPGHLSDEGSTRRQGTPSLCDDRPGPGNEAAAAPANAGEKRRRGGRPGLRLLEHPGASAAPRRDFTAAASAAACVAAAQLARCPVHGADPITGPWVGASALLP